MFDDDRPLSLGGGFGGFDAGAPAKPKPVIKPASKLAPAKLAPHAPAKPLAKPALHAPAKPLAKPGAKKQSTGRTSGKPGIAKVGKKLYPKVRRHAPARGRGRDTRGFGLDASGPTDENYMFADHDGKHWAGNLSPDGSFNPLEAVYEGAVSWAKNATPGHLYKMGPAPGFANGGDQGEYQAENSGGGQDSDATPAPQAQQQNPQGGGQGYQQPDQQQPLGLQAQPGADQGAYQLGGAPPQILSVDQLGDQPFAFAPGQLVLGSDAVAPGQLGLAPDGSSLALGAPAPGAQPLVAAATPLVIADSGEAGDAGAVGQLGVVNITSNVFSSPRGGDYLGRLQIGTPVRFERSTRHATLVRFRGGAGWIPRFNVDWDW